MSTLMGESPHQILKSEQDLLHYFDHYVKPPEGVLLGLEAEFLAVDRQTGKAVPYDGPSGIEAILKEFSNRFKFEPIVDEGRVIALKRKGHFIALEPGGQIELSASPVSNVFEIQEQIDEFLKEWQQVAQSFPDIRLLAVGMHPFSKLDEVTWVPKTRYGIMRDYMGRHGTQSHEMMKRTATNQLNVDYLNEKDAMEKLRVVFGITSIVTAIFSNSSFSEGSPHDFICRRLDIWNHTDPDRCGYLVEFTHPNKTFSDYLRYILEMPMIFIIRDQKWIPMEGKTFKDFIAQGHEGTSATLSDFELHLSTAFPEARIKQYLEVRGVDAQEPNLIPSVAAFWKGILYDEEARRQAWQLVADATDEERIKLHQSVPKEGLRAKLGSKPIFDLAAELVDIACKSLARQMKPGETRDECIFLDRMREKIIRPKKSPGETLVEKWNGDFKQDPSALIDYLSV